MRRVGHIKDGQPSAMVLLDAEMRFAIPCIVQQHRLAGHPGKFGKFRWPDENDFVRTVPRRYMAGHCEGDCSREGQLSDSDDSFPVHCASPYIPTIAH
jgi:hypothetical protein